MSHDETQRCNRGEFCVEEMDIELTTNKVDMPERC
jgi:hypothetical protein